MAVIDRVQAHQDSLDGRQDVPAVIDCPVDYRENTLLTRRLQEIMDSHKV